MFQLGAMSAGSVRCAIGALTGILGVMMAAEVIREIVGFGEGLVGRLMLVDAGHANVFLFKAICGERVAPSKAISGDLI